MKRYFADRIDDYGVSNICYLKEKLVALNAGTLPLEEYDLIEAD